MGCGEEKIGCKIEGRENRGVIGGLGNGDLGRVKMR